MYMCNIFITLVAPVKYPTGAILVLPKRNSGKLRDKLKVKSVPQGQRLPQKLLALLARPVAVSHTHL